jgi:hypothetical protein
MPNLHIINFKGSNEYNIVEGVNISQHFKLLEKYSPQELDDSYLYYNLKNDYRKTQTLIETEEKINFLNLIDTSFSSQKIKNGWYRLDKIQLGKLILFISDYIENIQGSDVTKTAEYICQKCQKHCLDKRTLVKHLKECPKVISYQCQNCHKKFVSNTCYQTHLLKCKSAIHQCQKCQKILSSSQALTRHQENCGDFSCSHCQKQFNSKYKYLNHCQIKHGFSPVV